MIRMIQNLRALWNIQHLTKSFEVNIPIGEEDSIVRAVVAAHKAQEKSVHTWTAADIGADPNKLGLNGSPTRVDRIFPPPARQKGEMFVGSPVELAAKLVEILKKESFVK